MYLYIIYNLLSSDLDSLLEIGVIVPALNDSIVANAVDSLKLVGVSALNSPSLTFKCKSAETDGLFRSLCRRRMTERVWKFQ